MLKTPVARLSIAWIARVQTSTTPGSTTERARPGVDDMPLGWLPPPK